MHGAEARRAPQLEFPVVLSHWSHGKHYLLRTMMCDKYTRSIANPESSLESRVHSFRWSFITQTRLTTQMTDFGLEWRLESQKQPSSTYFYCANLINQKCRDEKGLLYRYNACETDRSRQQCGKRFTHVGADCKYKEMLTELFFATPFSKVRKTNQNKTLQQSILRLL